MLDPRIYRTGFIAVVLAVIVFAFSLTDQQRPLSSTLAPDAFNGTSVMNTLNNLTGPSGYQSRLPGSFGDNDVAKYVETHLRQIYGESVSTTYFTGHTVRGNRTLETVVATKPGLSQGSIVILAHRDSLGSPSAAELSGTATLLELARVLAGQNDHHTIVFVSTSGSAGAAGATQVAQSLPGPVDAVIALGDLSSDHAHEPIIVPWSNSQNVAPPLLRSTVGAALTAQSGLKPGGTSLAGQLAHLAFPLTISEQGPFGTRGLPAVLLSVSGEGAPAPDEPVDATRLTAVGRAMLQAVSALDGGGTVPAATPYLLYDGKVIPVWAVRLLVLALILPVLGATIDGLARARRRGHSMARWIVWVLAGALPFVLALLLVLGARMVSFLSVVPAAPVAAGAVPLHAAGVALLVMIALLITGGLIGLRPIVITMSGGQRHLDGSASEGAGVALLLVMCVVALAIWATNPFLAALVVPALHLWMWVVDPEVRLRRVAAAVMLLVGLAPPALLVLYYAHTLSLGPVGALWNGVLMIAGGQVSAMTAIECSVLLGCTASAVLIAARAAREPAPEQLPITVRGPIGYAGPGSLGGTQSALRSRR